ncbi:hypothetical protein ACP4OV_022412 [Aristida adscensionis]
MAAAAAAVEDAAVRVTAKRWALAQFVLVLAVAILCLLLLYAPRLSPPTSVAFFPASARRDGATPASAPSVPGPRVGVGNGDTEGDGGGDELVHLDNQVGSPCASMPSHGICCDRGDYHSDVCFMAGDVRTDPASLSLLLFPPQSPPAAAAAAGNATAGAVEERIRPYTRKWDGYITRTIHEVRLRAAPRPEEEEEEGAGRRRCDVRHDAPVFVLTAAGYSHNLFHVFNDGFLPAWLTVQHLRRRVVLAVLSYNPRWAAAYGELVAGLSEYPVVDLLRDERTHCFAGAIVGTRYHDYLAVDPARLRDNKTVVDFHRFLAGAYEARGTTDEPPAPETTAALPRRPRLGIVSRKGRRVIENQAAVAALAASVGFDVDVMETATGAPLSAVYAAVSSYDALAGVHGADLTTFLFLRPGRAALAQIAPLGISLLSRNLFGVPAARMGLHYEQYDIAGGESSLSRRYSPEDAVVADPARARREQGAKEWELVEHVYLRGQNVTLDLGRFRETLSRMHSLLVQRRELHAPHVDATPQT